MAQNPYLHDSIIEKLISHPNERVRSNLAENSALSAKWQSVIVDDKSSDVPESLASNISLFPAGQRELVKRDVSILAELIQQ